MCINWDHDVMHAYTLQLQKLHNIMFFFSLLFFVADIWKQSKVQVIQENW
jgi:hypothetical protein